VVLQALERYYSILSEDEKSGIAPLGYSQVNVSYALILSPDGELLGVLPLKQEMQRGKKMVEIPQSMMVPRQEKRSVGIKSNFMCDNSSYTLGIDNKGKPERSKQCFQAFKELHEKILSGVSAPESAAMLNFVNHWNCEKAAENPILIPYLEEIVKGGNIIFKLDGGEYLHKNPQIKKMWEAQNSAETSDEKMQCLVTGEFCEIARLHPNLKGVRGAQSVGAALVSFNAGAYESYGRDKGQGYNAPVGKYAAFAYGTALNYLLSNPNSHINLGDTTVVFWAETSNPTHNAIASLCLTPPSPEEQDSSEALRQEVKTEALVADYLKKISNGLPAAPFEGVDEGVNFYILGLSPNAARVSTRFFIKDSFGGFLNKITQHYQNLHIQKQLDTDWDIIPLWKLLSETVSPMAKEKTASPLLSGSVFRAILTGSKYPELLYQTILLRVKTERSVTYVKASAIKACLIKKNKNEFKEVLTVALNEESNNKAYILGRLFAVLEKAQEEANGSSNMKDRFFTSACSTPQSVYPTLLKLSSHHIAKAQYGLKFEKMTGDLLGRLNVDDTPFPAHLTLDDQGIFILGYYQQRRSFFKTQS
jgi:CRISPR-associated protein Csd1